MPSDTTTITAVMSTEEERGIDSAKGEPRTGNQKPTAAASKADTKWMFAYRPDVDGIRAYAVLIVIIFHANTNTLKGGFIGVDVFFVISGYVVAGSLVRPRGVPRNAGGD